MWWVSWFMPWLCVGYITRMCSKMLSSLWLRQKQYVLKFVSDPITVFFLLLDFLKCDFSFGFFVSITLRLLLWIVIQKVVEFLFKWMLKGWAHLFSCAFCYSLDAQPLQWKQCKSFKSNSSKVLDIQFGISLTSLKMVSFKCWYSFSSYLMYCL